MIDCLSLRNHRGNREGAETLKVWREDILAVCLYINQSARIGGGGKGRSSSKKRDKVGYDWEEPEGENHT
jgi:hypothetical protein